MYLGSGLYIRGAFAFQALVSSGFLWVLRRRLPFEEGKKAGYSIRTTGMDLLLPVHAAVTRFIASYSL